VNAYCTLIIRYNVREKTLAQYFEPIVHLSIFMFSVGSAAIAAGLGLMNPVAVSLCWIAPYPTFFSEMDDIPCERGARYGTAVVLMVLLPFFAAVLIILISLSLVGNSVWRQRAVVRRQRLAVSQSDVASGEIPYGQREVSSASSSATGRISREFQQVPSSTVAKGSKKETDGSTPEGMANEAILQCVFSGAFSQFISTKVCIDLLTSFSLIRPKAALFLTQLFGLLHCIA
jgi:hypothetical protein